MHRIGLSLAYRIVLFVVFLIVVLLLNGTRYVAGSAAQSAQPVQLAWGTFDPLQSDPQQQIAREWQPSRAASNTSYWLIQFAQPLTSADRQVLADLEIELLAYVPQFTYIVRADAAALDAASELDWVRWMGAYAPAYRVEPELMTRRSAGPEALIVTLFPQADLARVSAELEALNIPILGSVTDDWKTILQLEMTLTDLPQVAAIDGINWIEPMGEVATQNATAAQITGVDVARSQTNGLGLTGKGQLIAVADTGIDIGLNDPTQLHADFLDSDGNSRIVQIFDRVGDGGEDHQGHGTHVAGTVLGNGAMSDGVNAGVAPEANLLFQSVARDDGLLAGIPWYLPWMFDEAYARVDGQFAKIHSNSWGMPNSTGLYSFYSLAVDEFMWNHPEFLIVFASGNEGEKGDYSVLAPATAKNALTVGATDNLLDSPNVLSSYSGRGPTRDGRNKPDLVAPGTGILSTATQLRFDDEYVIYNGTSMATPHVAGAAALVREYLANNGHDWPSASLVKAMLVNGSYDIALDAASTVTVTRPTNEAGWGRLDVANTFGLKDGKSITYWDSTESDTEKHAPPMSTGGRSVHTFPVYGSDQPLQITLAWTDYPGTTAANGALVNDLDLHVIQPDGTIVYPNNANSGGRADNYDHVNNLVGIDIENPQVGEYQIVVLGYNVAMSKQPYSVVVSGILQEQPDDDVCERAIDGAGSYQFCDLGLTLDVIEDSADTIRVTAISTVPDHAAEPQLMTARYYQVEVISAETSDPTASYIIANATFQYADAFIEADNSRSVPHASALGAFEYDGLDWRVHMPQAVDPDTSTMTVESIELSAQSDWGFGVNAVPTAITLEAQTAFSFANYLTEILAIFCSLALLTGYTLRRRW